MAEEGEGSIRSKQLVGRVLLEGADGRVEEVNHVLVLLVARAIACDIEGRRAGGVLGELVCPEVRVWRALVNPVLVH